MRFKIDENLPSEFAEMLRAAHHHAATVMDQGLGGQNDPWITDTCSREARVLITLDLDFADIRVYPPQQFPGFMVLRVRRQDKRHVLDVSRRVIPLIDEEPIENCLWIIEETRVRIRCGEKGPEIAL